VLRILPPAIYVRTRLTCRLASVDVAAGEACFQNHIKIFCTILTLRTCLVPACSPAPPQVGVSGGIRPSTPAAAPSGGDTGQCTAKRQLLPPSPCSILSGTSLKSFQRFYLGTFPKFLQRSQQLVWRKLPSSTYISREVHPVNILTRSSSFGVNPTWQSTNRRDGQPSGCFRSSQGGQE